MLASVAPTAAPPPAPAKPPARADSTATESVTHHKIFVGRSLRLRRREQSPKCIALADWALRRLTLRQRRMLHQGKHPNLVNIAIARELVGFVWNVLHPAGATA